MSRFEPDFIIIGAPKAATTTLWAVLRDQEGVFMTESKEPCFFSHDENYRKGWSWYQSLFDIAPQDAIKGEASPHYSLIRAFPKTAERIAANLPDVKLIYSVRNPYAALASAWRQYRFYGETMPNRHRMPSTFERALRDWPPLADTVTYWSALREFQRHFREEQIQIVYYEDIIDSLADVVHECLSFIGAPADPHIPNDRAHMNPGVGKSAYPQFVWRLRDLPGWRKTMRKIPRGWKSAVKAKLRKPVDVSQIWTDNAIEVADQLFQSEAKPLLNYTQRPPSFWIRPQFKRPASCQ